VSTLSCLLSTLTSPVQSTLLHLFITVKPVVSTPSCLLSALISRIQSTLLHLFITLKPVVSTPSRLFICTNLTCSVHTAKLLPMHSVSILCCNITTLLLQPVLYDASLSTSFAPDLNHFFLGSQRHSTIHAEEVMWLCLKTNSYLVKLQASFTSTPRALSCAFSSSAVTTLNSQEYFVHICVIFTYDVTITQEVRNTNFSSHTYT
jgi:hypothetical protein